MNKIALHRNKQRVHKRPGESIGADFHRAMVASAPEE